MADLIQSLAAKLEKLRRTDRDHIAFGSGEPNWGHYYLLAPGLDEPQLAGFEQHYGVTLPADYRQFLQQIGNGRVGPYYGLIALENAIQGCDPGAPFLFPNQQITFDEAGQEHWDEAAPGIVRLCQQGCGYWCFLVVNGENYGTVWNDYTAADNTIYPTGQTFAEWYEAWLDRVLRQLPNVVFKEKLEPGMTREQVMAVMGERKFEEWRRDGMAGYGILFEDVPLDIRFNDDNTVEFVFDQVIA